MVLLVSPSRKGFRMPQSTATTATRNSTPTSTKHSLTPKAHHESTKASAQGNKRVRPRRSLRFSIFNRRSSNSATLGQDRQEGRRRVNLLMRRSAPPVLERQQSSSREESQSFQLAKQTQILIDRHPYVDTSQEQRHDNLLRAEAEEWNASSPQSPRSSTSTSPTASTALSHPPLQQLAPTGVSCGTTASSILQHSYLLCGGLASRRRTTSFSSSDDEAIYETSENSMLSRRRNALPDDPTVQESIECIFPAQQQDVTSVSETGESSEEDDDEEDYQLQPHPLMAPSILQQSLLRTRSDTSRSLSPQRSRNQGKRASFSHIDAPPTQANASSIDPSKHDERHASFASSVQVGTFDPESKAADEHPDVVAEKLCSCTRQEAPNIDPELWPQRPLMMRPGNGTKIKGVRFSASKDYLWTPTQAEPWTLALERHWGSIEPANARQHEALSQCCSRCCVLPVNNGNEPIGEALVTDFESDLFDGTILVRLRYSKGSTKDPYDDSIGYFAGMNRRYQAVVSGRFKKSISMTECVNGFRFKRLGKLPPRWIVKGAMKVVHFFAPQLRVVFDGPRPSSLTPLGSTPQCVIVSDDNIDLEKPHKEPAKDSETLLGKAFASESSVQRARFRKRNFDKLFVQKSAQPKTDTSKVYTFEFLQHLFNFNDLSVELGSLLGSMKLKEILDGQPLQIMALYAEQEPLWAFDVWHDVLVEDAKKYDRISWV